MNLQAKSQRKRAVRLIAKPFVEKAWAAVALLGKHSPDSWVDIDDVGDFLKKRQIDAGLVDFISSDPSTRYALRPGVSQFPKGWDDHSIATALAAAANRQLVQHERRREGNFFKAVFPEDHSLWKVPNTALPQHPTWNL